MRVHRLLHQHLGDRNQRPDLAFFEVCESCFCTSAGGIHRMSPRNISKAIYECMQYNGGKTECAYALRLLRNLLEGWYLFWLLNVGILLQSRERVDRLNRVRSLTSNSYSPVVFNKIKRNE